MGKGGSDTLQDLSYEKIGERDDNTSLNERRQEIFILVTSDLKICQARKKKPEIFFIQSQYNIITLPLINGRKNVNVDLPIRPAISLPFCISCQHQKIFPSMFQAMICLICLSLPFLSRPIYSKSFSTEVRYVSHLDFYSSYNKNSSY